jgi:hypothetical protein
MTNCQTDRMVRRVVSVPWNLIVSELCVSANLECETLMPDDSPLVDSS